MNNRAGSESLSTAHVRTFATIQGCVEALRSAGVKVTISQFERALRLLPDAITARNPTYWTLRLNFCTSLSDVAIFDRVFRSWFDGVRAIERESRQPIIIARPVAIDGDGHSPEPGTDEDLVPASSSSRVEILRHADIARLTRAEKDEVERMISLLLPRITQRRTRRRVARLQGAIDRRATIRSIIKQGGEITRLPEYGAKKRQRKMIVIVDVSGSMATYSGANLRFAYAIRQASSRTLVATIGTRLTLLKNEFDSRDVDRALKVASSAIPDWSGGTSLGIVLDQLFKRERERVRGGVVIIFSDGWERGDTSVLQESMKRISLCAYKILWVNPHVFRDGFAPSTAGMQAALPYIDALVSGHSFDSFQRVAQLLGEVA